MFKKRKYIELTLNINARLQPITRGEFYEDTLNSTLKKCKIGSVVGGGTSLSQDYVPDNCDVEIDCRPEKLDELKMILSKLPLPKGSRLIFDDESEADIPLGDLDGVGVYLNGTDLPKEVYAKCDLNTIVGDLISAMQSELLLFDYWHGKHETALYFYGNSFDAMKSAVESYAATCPLFEKSHIEKLC